MRIPVSRHLERASRTPHQRAWFAALPDTIADLSRRWSLELGPPFEGEEVSAAWVAPAIVGGRERAVLKVALPHMEAQHEIDGLRFWDGDAIVRLLDADDARGAMLLERCDPGLHLRSRPEPEQDLAIAGLLRRLWRVPHAGHPFRPLSAMIVSWAGETEQQRLLWPDRVLVEEGLRLLRELPGAAVDEVLLHTDLHAGNVLSAAREPWLAIDPKPFVGDPAYDATQHLLNCRSRLQGDPRQTIRRFADLLGVDETRVGLWTFARCAADPRDDWHDGSLELARLLSSSIG